MVVITFSSCSDDIMNENLKEGNLSSATIKKSHRLSPVQAIERAGKFLGNSTRSSNLFSVGYVTNPVRTRGEGSDTLFYVINYANEEGFMLVPTDDRLEPVYAYSEKGNMHLSDTVNNKMLRNYMYGAIADANVALSLDTTKLNADIDIKVWQVSNKIKGINPMISEFQSKMHQAEPYNLQCPIVHWTDTRKGIDTDTFAVAGCGPVAVEMLMSYFRYPVLYKGFIYNWNGIVNGYTPTHIAKLLATIGDKDHMNASYGRQATFTYSSTVPTTLRKMGYSCELANFDEAIAEEQLAKHPLYVDAYNYNGGGHAMVIDGVDVYVPKTWNYGSPAEPPKSRYFHIVWGWGGINNGYYHISTKYFQDIVPHYYWEFDRPTTADCNVRYLSRMLINVSTN